MYETASDSNSGPYGDEEGPETENGAPESRVRLVADAESPRQRRSCQISIFREVRHVGQILHLLAGVGLHGKVSTRVVDATEWVALEHLAW